MSSRILLPENMICINHGHLFDTCIITKQAFVVYIDSTQCQACRINNIGDYNFVRRISQNQAAGYENPPCASLRMFPWPAQGGSCHFAALRVSIVVLSYAAARQRA